jgi:hypothetical protein
MLSEDVDSDRLLALERRLDTLQADIDRLATWARVSGRRSLSVEQSVAASVVGRVDQPGPVDQPSRARCRRHAPTSSETWLRVSAADA